MPQLESSRPARSASAARMQTSPRTGMIVSLIGIAALVVIFVVALLQAANEASVLGWILAAIALGWLLLALFVLWMVRKAAKFGAAQMERAQRTAEQSFGRAPAAAGSASAGGRSITDEKLRHSFQIIMVQANQIAANLPAADGSAPGDRAQVDRALDTIAVTASNGMGIIQDASEPISGDVVDDGASR